MKNLQVWADTMRSNLEQWIVGKPEVLDRILIALLCRGHILLDDLPGTGKTTLAKATAHSMDGIFHRLQFTPDLLPSDVVGVNVYQQKTQDFQFRQGSVFCHILLADEINRATPRTQSALLECMEEQQVTVDGVTYPLPQPFFVIATQNPVEWQGTFPLPEAQLDRFLFCLRLGYPAREQEQQMLRQFTFRKPDLSAVTTPEQLTALQSELEQVKMGEAVQQYLLDIAAATRSHREIRVGLSPRGLLALSRAARGMAAISGRDYVTPDDVQTIAADVIAHRILQTGIPKTEALQEKRELVAKLLAEVPVPKDMPWNS